MDDKATELRHHADHCRRLACEISDERTRTILRAMATEFDEQAAQMVGEQATHKRPGLEPSRS